MGKTYKVYFSQKEIVANANQFTPITINGYSNGMTKAVLYDKHDNACGDIVYSANGSSSYEDPKIRVRIGQIGINIPKYGLLIPLPYVSTGEIPNIKSQTKFVAYDTNNKKTYIKFINCGDIVTIKIEQ
jgi:hypothetical protein